MKRIVLLLVLAMSCRKNELPGSEPEVEHRDETEHQQLERKVRLSDEEQRTAQVTIGEVKRGTLHTTLSLVGEIVAEPDRSARLSSPAAGRIEQVMFNEGSVVKRGEVLLTVRVPDVSRLRSAFAAATAKAKAAHSNVARLTALQQSGLAAAQPLADAQADASAQEAEAAALGDQLAAIGVSATSGGFLVSLRAPISGVVVSRDAVLGQPVTPERVLASLVDVSEVWFLGRIFEKDLARVHAGAAAEVELNAWPTAHFHGVVDYVSQQIDPMARTLTARVRLINEDGRLRIGLFGRAHVDLATEREVEPTLLVPRDAIVELAGGPVVFVRASDGDFVMHEVKLGESALDDVQVLSGLKEGEAIAVSGVFTLKSRLLKATLEEAD